MRKYTVETCILASLVVFAACPSIATALAFGFSLAAMQWEEYQKGKVETAKKVTEVVAEKALADANKRFEELSDDVQKLKLALRIRTGV